MHRETIAIRTPKYHKYRETIEELSRACMSFV